jgi:ubiquinone/menaquinone biosynthesis C-methylase UbiE
MFQDSVLFSPHVSAKLIPLERREVFGGEEALRTCGPSPATIEPEGGPVPPEELREGWIGASYLRSGRRDMDAMQAIVEQAGESLTDARRVLDFGCATGRLLRFYPDAADRECWGVDVKASSIAWCQQHLTPPFLFATTTTFPHLPFEDNYFDVVYCGSVFTHIGDVPDATLLELRRILRPGGLAYVTVHDERSVQALLERFQERELTRLLRRLDAETGVLGSSYKFFCVGADPGTQIFYDSDYLVGKWSGFMEVVSITPEAMDYQTALLLRKRPAAQ